ncbi:MAG TPA: methylaspartate ammonia-lyase [Anaerolineae bacterium]|nr:methylaspartate ammonia-lyase [Anaerolineae bacterium]
MRITRVLASPALTGFYADDQEAIRQDAEHDGFAYTGSPVTPGFVSVRQRGEAVTVLIVLEDGQVAYGDCATVQYPGVGGRDPVFEAGEFIDIVRSQLEDGLVGRELASFRSLAEEYDQLRLKGMRLQTALRYGLSQALLDAVSKAKHKTMAEVIVEEYDIPLVLQPVPIFAQSGDERHQNVDKMILKRVDVLPHGLINNVRTKLGSDGELLLEFVRWIKSRVDQLAGGDYSPTLHFDVYGTIGLAFDGDTECMADYIGTLEKAAAPWELHIECPVIAHTREGQIRAMRALRDVLRRKGIGVLIVSDEWCNSLHDIVDFIANDAVDMVQIKTPSLGGINNSIEALLYTKSKGVAAYLGGSCNETDRSAQVSVHVAIATQPRQMLAKPGMGVDEGLMVVYNEMQRTLALLQQH